MVKEMGVGGFAVGGRGSGELVGMLDSEAEGVRSPILCLELPGSSDHFSALDAIANSPPNRINTGSGSFRPCTH